MPFKATPDETADGRYHDFVNLDAVFASILLLVIGAAIGVIPTYLSERRKERHELAIRWDGALYELCGDFSTTVREFVHLARRHGRVANEEQRVAQLEKNHAHLRGLAQQIRLLGSRDLQQAAREVEHHAWWVRAVSEGREDRLADYYAGMSPEERLRDALLRLYVAARVQLGVPKPEDVAPDDPIDPSREPVS